MSTCIETRIDLSYIHSGGGSIVHFRFFLYLLKKKKEFEWRTIWNVFEKPEFSGRGARIYETLTKNTIPEIHLYFFILYIFLCVDPWNTEKKKIFFWRKKKKTHTQQVLLPSPVSTFITKKEKKCVSLYPWSNTNLLRIWQMAGGGKRIRRRKNKKK